MLALAHVGAEQKKVYSEHIAAEAHRLAPPVFGWELPEYREKGWPDKEKVRIALIRLRSEHGFVDGGYAKDTADDGWRLTTAGVEWVRRNGDRLAASLGDTLSRSHRRELVRKLARIRDHALFRDFQSRPDDFVPSLGALAELFRCRVDAEPSTWEKRFTTLRNQARLADQDDLLTFLDICASHVESTTCGDTP